jgi:spore maturation protein CgeB
MNILYVALKHDFGKPERGYSFEHCNFYDTLCRLGHNVLYFDFMALAKEHGREWLNRRLWELVKSDTPDLMFTVLAWEDQLEKSVVRQISEETDTITVNWFCDDHYRFENYSCDWAPCFNWIITTDESALPKYTRLGCHHVIHKQWGCNHFLYRNLHLPLRYDVTFVGTRFGNRIAFVQALRDAGINVHVWGAGWDSSRLSQDEMIRVFNESRINLNFAEAACPAAPAQAAHRGFARRCLSRSLRAVPFGPEIRRLGKRWLSSPTTASSSHSMGSNGFPKQIKGRNFEVPGCGGFLLAEAVQHLDKYYDAGKEIGCFAGADDLVDKVRYYLQREDEGRAIAQAGHDRTLNSHTYERRFTEIFEKIGVSP